MDQKVIDNMDTECIPICEAMNEIYGVQTRGSCCGHGETRFMIYFNCYNTPSLYFITTAVEESCYRLPEKEDPHYGSWECNFLCFNKKDNKEDNREGRKYLNLKRHKLQNTDPREGCLCPVFYLTTLSMKGEEAYQSADCISEQIYELLNKCPDFRKYK